MEIYVKDLNNLNSNLDNLACIIIDINIGENSNNITPSALNTYLNCNKYNLGGVHIIRVHAHYNNICTILVNGIAAQDTRAIYGIALCLSYYQKSESPFIYILNNSYNAFFLSCYLFLLFNFGNLIKLIK